MTPGHVFAIVQAECVKLSTRTSARLGMLLAASMGLALPLLLWMMDSDAAMVNGASLADSLQASAPKGAAWALYLRNLWVMQAVVLLLVAQSLAGELQARTLREDLLRPVSRGTMLVAKFCAIALFITLTLAAQYVLASAFGLLLFGTEGPWREVLMGYVASGLADLSFAAVAFSLTALLRSVAGTVLVTMMAIVFEKLASWALFVASGIVQALPPEMNQLPEPVYWLFDLQPALPSAAWSVGSALAAGEAVAGVTWASMVLYFAVGALIALGRTIQMEVP